MFLLSSVTVSWIYVYFDFMNTRITVTVILIWPIDRNALLCKSLFIYFLLHMATNLIIWSWNIYKLVINCNFQAFIPKYQYLYQRNLLVSDKKITYMFLSGVFQSVFHKRELFVERFDFINLHLSLDPASFVTSLAKALRVSSISRRLLLEFKKILTPKCFLLVLQPYMEQFAPGIWISFL